MSGSKFDIKMRELEQKTNLVLDNDKIVIVRVDGKSFHTFHKNFDGHFSLEMQDAMNAALMYVMKKVPEVQFAYTNSDELTFVLLPNAVAYSNRVEKITSIFASLVTAAFNYNTKFDDLALFDARTFNVDSLELALDNLHWRQASGQRNSINTYAREFLSKSEMKYKHSKQLEGLMAEKGLPPMDRDGFYYGYYIARQTMKLEIAKDNMYKLGKLFLDRK